jgi:hypothetical protein
MTFNDVDIFTEARGRGKYIILRLINPGIHRIESH